MATTAPIRIELQAEDNASGAIGALAREIEQLGGKLEGELRDNALQAAQALRELSDKSAAADKFFQLKQRVQETGTALKEAQTNAQTFARELAATGSATAQQDSRMQGLRKAVNDANDAHVKANAALNSARDNLSRYGLSTDGLAKSQAQLKTQLEASRASLAGMPQELRDAAAAAQEMERAQKQAAKETAQAERDRAAALKEANAATEKATQAARRLAEENARSPGVIRAIGDAWRSTVGQFAAGAVIGNMITGLMGKVRDMGREFVRANVEIEGMRRALNAIYKDGSVAEQQIGFLRKTANEAGVSFSSLTDSYKSFTASATAANIPLATQNELFASVAKAGATLGLSGDAVSRALLALSQMASKGTVSMEELRQQLGESLPGALSLAAKGLGLTEQELIKLVESGGLAARDLFPALAQSLKSMAGENNSASAAWERLKSAIAQTMTAVGDSGGMSLMTVAIKGLGLAVGAVLIPLQALTEFVFSMFRGMGALAASVAVLTDTTTTWATKQAQMGAILSAFNDDLKASDERVNASTRAFGELALGADKVAASTTAAGKAAAGSTADYAQFSQQWVSIGQVMRDAAAEQERAAANSTKLAQAAKTEGDAMVALVALRGDATASAQAEAAASDRTAQALQAVATARAAQLEIVQAELTAKQNMIAGSAEEQKAREAEIKGLTDKVEKLKAEAEASRQTAEAARNEAVAKKAAADATQDHSHQIGRLTEEMNRATATVREYERLQIEGKKTVQEVAEAKREQALAEARLRDAYTDTMEVMRARHQLEQAQRDAAITAMQAELELAKVEEQRARQRGNEYEVRQAIIKQREVEIRIAHAEIDAAIAVAEARITEMRAMQEQLRANEQLTTARRLEIEAAIKAAEAQITLAKARREGVQLLEEQVQKLRSGVIALDDYEKKVRSAATATRESAKDMVGDYDKVRHSVRELSKEAAELQRSMAQKYGRAGQSESYSTLERGWSKDASGNIVSAASDPLWEEFLRISSTKYDLRSLEGVAHRARDWDAFRAAAQRRDAAPAPSAPAPSPSPTTTSGSAASAGMSSGSGPVYISNITLGGRTTSIRTADADSQRRLEELLRELTYASSTAVH